MSRWLIIGLACMAICLRRDIGARAESEFGPKASVLDSKSTVDDVLNALKASGKDVNTFSADVQDTEDELIQGTEVIRYGKVWFQAQPDGQAVLHLLLDHKVVANKQIPEKIEYLLEAGWLTERNFDTRMETRVQLVQPGQKVNLFQLGKGPFPLPIGQDPQDVHAQFDVSIPAQDKDDPKGTTHLLLKPKPGTPLADNFFAVEVWVDGTNRMPAQIMTQNKRQSELKIWNLTNLVVNHEINKSDATLPPLGKDWKTMDKPLQSAVTPGQN